LDPILESLYYYSLNHPGREFIHQHVVDASTLQSAGLDTKPLAVVFSLLGLYLYLYRGFTGKEVQGVHMKLARWKNELPVVIIPSVKGKLTPKEVMAEPAGVDRDLMIKEWCLSVWKAYAVNEKSVRDWLTFHEIVR
jgi:hypothetical protein